MIYQVPRSDFPPESERQIARQWMKIFGMVAILVNHGPRHRIPGTLLAPVYQWPAHGRRHRLECPRESRMERVGDPTSLAHVIAGDIAALVELVGPHGCTVFKILRYLAPVQTIIRHSQYDWAKPRINYRTGSSRLRGGGGGG